MKHPMRDHPESDDITPQQRREAAAGPTELFEAQQPIPASPAPAPVPEPMMKKEPAPRAPMVMNDPGHTMVLGIRSNAGTEAVVGWLVVVDGPGRGNYRSIYSGSNTIGRSSSQRIPINFGDDSISADQQAFLVYDAKKRQFQLVPNLGRPNLVHLNDSALLAGAELKAHDKITMGQTTLLFVPLCGTDFDWSDMQ